MLSCHVRGILGPAPKQTKGLLSEFIVDNVCARAFADVNQTTQEQDANLMEQNCIYSAKVTVSQTRLAHARMKRSRGAHALRSADGVVGLAHEWREKHLR